MKLFKRWQSDKKFRMNFVIGFIIFLVVITNISLTEKKEAVSEQYCNGIIKTFLGATYTSSIKECESVGCSVQTNTGGQAILAADDVTECVAKIFGLSSLYEIKCTKSVPNGKFVFNSADSCQSGYGVERGKICGPTVYECKAPPDKSFVCSSNLKGIAKILDSIWKGNGITDCNTKAYIVLGAVALVFMAVI